MKDLKYIFIATVLLLLYSCKEEYFLYNDVKRLQFGPDKSRIYTPSFDMNDTTKLYTFYYENTSIQTDTVFFDLYAIGGVSNKDRAYKLEQVAVPGAENAVAGKHYKAFNDASLSSTYVIKAGAVHSKVPVIMLRDASLKTTTVILKFQVVENDNFSQGEITKTWRKVIFTDRLSQPYSWNAWMTQYVLGKYSVVKHRFFIETTGLKWDEEFLAFLYANNGDMKYWQGVVKVNLADYNAKHPGDPLKDENGEIILLP